MEKTTKTAIRVIDLPARQMAYIRHVGPYQGDADLFEKLFTRVMSWLQGKNLTGPGMEALSVYHDDPESVPPERQRISVGFTVPVGNEGAGEILMMALPAGKYAVGSFEIHPEGYGQAWGEMMAYLERHRLTPAAEGPMYESYKNDPSQHPQGKHLVDICLALAG